MRIRIVRSGRTGLSFSNAFPESERKLYRRITEAAQEFATQPASSQNMNS